MKQACTARPLAAERRLRRDDLTIDTFDAPPGYHPWGHAIALNTTSAVHQLGESGIEVTGEEIAP